MGVRDAVSLPFPASCAQSFLPTDYRLSTIDYPQFRDGLLWSIQRARSYMGGTSLSVMCGTLRPFRRHHGETYLHTKE